MIVVDTSALMAVLLGEPDGDRCVEALEHHSETLISAGALAEAMLVADRRNIDPELRRLVEDLEFEVVPVTGATSAAVALAYARWGRGMHPAGLNLGDGFAYALANELNLPLLYVGEDFAKTDLASA